MFSLSSAGQPQVWNEVCYQCLEVVRSLTGRLTAGKSTSSTPLDQSSQDSDSDHRYVPTGRLHWMKGPGEIVATISGDLYSDLYEVTFNCE